MGKNICGIYNMGFPYGNISAEEGEQFINFLQSLNFKYLFAITANYYQRSFAKILKAPTASIKEMSIHPRASDKLPRRYNR